MITAGLEGHSHGESGGLEPRAAFDRHLNGGAITTGQIFRGTSTAGAFQYVVNHHLVVSIFGDDDVVHYQVIFRFAADIAYAIAAGAPLAGGSFRPATKRIRPGLGLVGHSRLSGNDRGRHGRRRSQRGSGDRLRSRRCRAKDKKSRRAHQHTHYQAGGKPEDIGGAAVG